VTVVSEVPSPEQSGGRPDLGVVVAGLITGHVELQPSGTGAVTSRFTGHNRQQWGKF